MTPLVLVHGFMGGSAQWEWLPTYLREFDLVTLDLPGFGKNAQLPVIDRIEDFADWVIAELRARDIERYHLLGHSMGGMIAQDIARKDRAHIERLVLYSTGPVGVIPGRFETIETSKERARADGAAQTARRIAATWFLKCEAADAFAGCAEIAAQAKLPAILAGLEAMKHWNGQGGLVRIEPETLVLWGDCDRTYLWEQTQLLWAQIPNATLSVVSGCAHAVHLEKTDLFSAMLDDFLSR